MSSFLYNPHLQPSEQIIRSFLARQELLARVVEDLRGVQPPHLLFVGQRGMGKTTLLRRIAAEIEEDPELSKRWLPLRFPEEQYNIATLSDFYLNCLDALADALERQGKAEEVAQIDRFVADLPDDELQRSTLARERLLEVAHGQRGLVLFVDNLQQVLGRLEREQWALRKLLGEEDRLVVIGASPADLQQNYGAAFYDFFQSHRLRGLNLEQTRKLLLGMARQEGNREAEEAIVRYPGRVGAMQVLTGGNPRIVAMLFQVIARSPGADVRGQLDALLDQITPLYKARFEELSEQAQRLLDALALHWNPATAHDIAERTRIEVNSVSTQLHRLFEEGIVEKVDIPGINRQGFQVSERFFNVWYLMRASRRLRGRLLALAHCLETLYGLEDLQLLADQVLQKPAEPDFSVALARLLPGDPRGLALLSQGLDQAFSAGALADLMAQLGPEDAPVRDMAARKQRAREIEARVQELGLVGEEAENVVFGVLVGRAEVGEFRFTEKNSIPSLSISVGQSVRQVRYFLGKVTFAKVLAALRAGELYGVPGFSDPGPNLALVAKSRACPQLLLWDEFHRHEASESGLPPEFIQACLGSGDADLLGLISLLCIDRPMRKELALRAVELAPHEVKHLETLLLAAAACGDRETLGHAALSGVRLGSNNPMVQAVAWMATPQIDQAERDVYVRALFSNPAAETAICCFVCAKVAAAQDDVEHTLRFYQRAIEKLDPLEHLDQLHQILGHLIRQNHIPEAMQLVLPLQDRALPLYVAMTAVEGQDARLVHRYAPEIAEPATKILNRLWPEALRPAPPSEKGSKKKRKT